MACLVGLDFIRSRLSGELLEVLALSLELCLSCGVSLSVGMVRLFVAVVVWFGAWKTPLTMCHSQNMKALKAEEPILRVIGSLATP